MENESTNEIISVSERDLKQSFKAFGAMAAYAISGDGSPEEIIIQIESFGNLMYEGLKKRSKKV